jgi:hypothetical protein
MWMVAVALAECGGVTVTMAIVMVMVESLMLMQGGLFLAPCDCALCIVHCAWWL